MKSALIPLLLAICMPACSRTPKAPDDLNADYALRQFFDVRSIIGVTDVPRDDSAYFLTVLEFEDGKLERRGLALYGKAEFLAGRTLKAQLLWSTGTSTVCLVGPGMAGKSKSDFWQKLDGGLTSFGSDVQRQQYDGFTILAFAQSDVRRDGGKNSPMGSNFQGAVQRQKFVGALALKTFKTQEEASREAETR